MGIGSPPRPSLVARVNRDFLRRSRIGAIVTRRDPVALATPVSGVSSENLAYGVDALINPTNEVSILGYAAKTDSPARSGHDQSYRGRFDWNADRYGLQAPVGGDRCPRLAPETVL